MGGSGGDDLLIGGSATNENDLASLDAALAAWANGNLTSTLLHLGSQTDDFKVDDWKGGEGEDQLFEGVGDKLKQ